MIQGKRISLKPVEPGDADPLWDILNDPETLDTLADLPQAITKANAFNRMAASDAMLFTVLAPGGRVIGVKCLERFDWRVGSARLGVTAIHKDWRGRGINVEGVHLLRDYAFSELRLHRLWADFWHPKERILRYCEATGAIYEGRLRDAGFKNGRWIDKQMTAFINAGE